jgi:hypothetical protein
MKINTKTSGSSPPTSGTTPNPTRAMKIAVETPVTSGSPQSPTPLLSGDANRRISLGTSERRGSMFRPQESVPAHLQLSFLMLGIGSLFPWYVVSPWLIASERSDARWPPMEIVP